MCSTVVLHGACMAFTVPVPKYGGAAGRGMDRLTATLLANRALSTQLTVSSTSSPRSAEARGGPQGVATVAPMRRGEAARG